MAQPIIGTVSSTKGDKTIVVIVETRKTHPLYRKQYTVSKKFMAHDEKNSAQVGDRVSIVETNRSAPVNIISWNGSLRSPCYAKRTWRCCRDSARVSSNRLR